MKSAVDQKLIDTVINFKEIEYTGVDGVDLVEEALIDGANLFTDIDGVDLLTYSLKRENFELVDYLAQVSYKGKKFDLNAYIDEKDTLLTSTVRSHFTKSEATELLIKHGADVNKVDKEGNSPLILAIQNERLTDVDLLMDSGADINYLSPNKISPFLVACQGTNSMVVQQMIDKKVNINQVNPIGVNGLMLALNAFGMYATKEDKEQRKKIIEMLLANNIDVNTVAKSGLTALWSSFGSWKAMDLITSKGGDLYAKHNLPQENIKPFAHRLMEMQVVKIAQEYKNKGQEESKAQKPKKKEEPGIFADSTRKAIFADFRVGVADSDGNTLEAICVVNPLLVKNYKKELMEILLTKDIDVNQYYKTPVTQTHQKKVVVPFISAIIEHFNEQEFSQIYHTWKEKSQVVSFDFKEQININHNPLISCLAHGKLKTLMLLLKDSEVKLNDMVFENHVAKKSYHITEIFQSIMKSSGLEKIQQELQQTNAILEGIETNKKNGVKSTLLKDEDVAKQHFSKQKVELEKNLDTLLKFQEECANVLKYVGVDFNYVSPSGTPSIFNITDENTLDLFEKMGADKNVKAKNGDNFLVHAILTGNYEIIPYINDIWSKKNPELLAETLNQILYHENLNDRVQQSIVENGLVAFLMQYSKKDADDKVTISYPFINEKDEDGNTPFLVAASNDYFYVMKKLVDAGADINAKNNNGETAIMHAIANENHYMVKFLLENKVDVNVVNNDGITIDDLLEDVEDKELIKMVDSYFNGEFNPDNPKVKFKSKR